MTEREKLIELIEKGQFEYYASYGSNGTRHNEYIADYLLANGVIVPSDYSKIPMQENDADAKTIGEYLLKLLLTLWDEKESFSGKRPFGNSSWEYEIYTALISSGVIMGSLDEEGYVIDVDWEAADIIVREIISREDAEKALKGGWSDVQVVLQ